MRAKSNRIREGNGRRFQERHKGKEKSFCFVVVQFELIFRHAMAYLIPTYMQKLESNKPLKETVKRWTKEAISFLQGCFDCNDWAMFSESCAD